MTAQREGPPRRRPGRAREESRSRRLPTGTVASRVGHVAYDAREAGETDGARHREWDCPVCGGERHLRADLKPHRLARDPTWLWICNDCGSGSDLLQAVAEACSERDGEKYRWTDLIDGPPDWLGEPAVATGQGSAAEKDPPPLEGEIALYHRALLTGNELDPSGLTIRRARLTQPLDHLADERGLTRETIEEYEIGYAERGQAGGPFTKYRAFTIPVRSGRGRLLNLRKRFHPRTPKDSKGKPIKYVGLRGYGAQLYPLSVFADEPEAFVVCEGEFDALISIQNGFPAVTSTAGRSWNEEWNRYVEGRYVAVIYDADAESFRKARARAAEFRAAGAEDAWAVDLRRAGLRRKEDLTDYFTTGYRAADLRDLINRSRKEAI